MVKQLALLTINVQELATLLYYTCLAAVLAPFFPFKLWTGEACEHAAGTNGTVVVK